MKKVNINKTLIVLANITYWVWWCAAFNNQINTPGRILGTTIVGFVLILLSMISIEAKYWD